MKQINLMKNVRVSKKSKVVMLLFLTSIFFSLQTQAQIYSAITETGSRFNAGFSLLDGVTPIITYDDVPISTATLGTPASLDVKQITVGIRRITGAPAVTVNFYYAQVDGFGDLILPGTYISSVPLAALVGSSATQLVTVGDGISTLFTVPEDYTTITGYGTIAIGISLSSNNSLNGWRVTTGVNVDGMWLDDPADPSYYGFYSFGGVPVATFYIKLFGNAITNSGLSATCAGSTTSLPFFSAGTYTAGNTYTAELSDASGSFASPTSIGTLASTASGSQSMSVTIPGSESGSEYRIRVTSSNPPSTGDESSDITIDPLTPYYADADGDGYGDPGTSVLACPVAPSGYVGNNLDCDDTPITGASINPAAAEICNGVDDDCDGLTDDADPSITGQSTWYTDLDDDGFGDVTDITGVLACFEPALTSSDNTDCDDTNGSVNPGASEVCNGVDDDCAGGADDGLTFTDYYADGDGDGYGAGSASNLCADPGAGYSTTAGDCDDGDGSVNPGATEICNGIDDDCAGGADDGLTFTDYYADGDGDGYGAGSASNLCADPGAGYSTTSGDCDDGDGSVNPAATEVCNGIDDDCAGGADDGLTFTDYYADGDGDGYGAGSASNLCADPGAGYTTTAGDCDDADGSVNPAATEVCNGIDDNCDGNTDENVITATITAGGSTTICKGTSVLLSANTGAGYTYIWRRNGNNIAGATSSSYAATKSGLYTVFIIIPGGCVDESSPVSVTALASPNATVNNLTGGTDLCFAPVIKLKASGGAGVTYSWLKNGVPTGITTAAINVTSIGIYQVVVTQTSTGCVKTSTGINIIKTCKAGDIEIAENLTVYPNPTSGAFTVSLDMKNGSIQEATITVFNALGQSLMQQTAGVSNGILTENVSLSNVSASGVYYVQVEANGNRWMQQIVVTK